MEFKKNLSTKHECVQTHRYMMVTDGLENHRNKNYTCLSYITTPYTALSVCNEMPKQALMVIYV